MRAYTAPATISDALLRHVGIPRHLVLDLALILAFSWITALCARVAFFIPGVPVAVTGQTFAVLLTGALLGSRRGALSLMAYLAQGAVGLPVFTISATMGYGGGLLRFSGPSGGYLIGFLIAAYVVGLLAERGWDRRFWSTALAMLIGAAIIHLVGLPWLARFFVPTWLVDWQQNLLWLDPTRGLFLFGLYPYIPGDLVKLVLAAAALPSAWSLLRRWGK